MHSVNTVSFSNTVNTLISPNFFKSCEKGFITKERMVTQTHFKIAYFKWASHFSTLALMSLL